MLLCILVGIGPVILVLGLFSLQTSLIIFGGGWIIALFLMVIIGVINYSQNQKQGKKGL